MSSTLSVQRENRAVCSAVAGKGGTYRIRGKERAEREGTEEGRVPMGTYLPTCHQANSRRYMPCPSVVPLQEMDAAPWVPATSHLELSATWSTALAMINARLLWAAKGGRGTLLHGGPVAKQGAPGIDWEEGEGGGEVPVRTSSRSMRAHPLVSLSGT